ncbi:MAG TPA: FAD-binding oxidoreductase, partial [Solirubrobacteraceae bacterium]|nr:FAD-binding oxidoreductase [Solirubrobacteraceae bacterium]
MTITTRTRPAGRPALDGRFVLPDDPGFDEVRLAWNLAADQHPVAVALPVSGADVAATVRFARDNGLRVAPQGTGHNATAIDSLEDTVLLKTSQMRGISIDAPNRRARVDAGVLWAEVTAPAHEHGLLALGGSSPDVGVVGYSLGGGLSWLGRKYGLATNHVVAADVVTADGELRRVDADHDPDLFWALRGGGGSFAAVTALEFELFPIAEIYAGAMLWPAEQASEVMHAWREWTQTVPEDVTTSARILQFPPLSEVPEPMRGRAFVVIDGAVAGDPQQARELVEPLRALGPQMDTFATLPAPALQQIHMDPEDPMPGHSDHTMLRALPPAALDALLEVADPATGSPLLMVELRHLGGALGRVPEDAGALGAFNGEYLFFAGGIPMDPGVTAALEAHFALTRAALAPYQSGSVYLNFTEQPVDTATIYRPDAYRRLREVKAAYDP